MRLVAYSAPDGACLLCANCDGHGVQYLGCPLVLLFTYHLISKRTAQVNRGDFTVNNEAQQSVASFSGMRYARYTPLQRGGLWMESTR
jgi:hypothetical protein